MTLLPKRQLTAEEFQAWALKQPQDGHGKFELVDGVVMQRASRNARASASLVSQCTARSGIKRTALSCFAAVDGPTVRIHE
jgi:hypothetical protein